MHVPVARGMIVSPVVVFARVHRRDPGPVFMVHQMLAETSTMVTQAGRALPVSAQRRCGDPGRLPGTRSVLGRRWKSSRSSEPVRLALMHALTMTEADSGISRARWISLSVTVTSWRGCDGAPRGLTR